MKDFRIKCGARSSSIGIKFVLRNIEKLDNMTICLITRGKQSNEVII